MKKILCIAMLLTGLGLFVAPSAMALKIGFAPPEQFVNVGDSINVDIVVSELGGGIVSAYDLDVLYDPEFLKATNVAFGIYLAPALYPILASTPFPMSLQFFDLANSGLVDINELSLVPNSALYSQPDKFALATVSFEVIALGNSSIKFSFEEPNYVLGQDPRSPLQLEVSEGKVAPVPEPATLLLLGAGLTGLAGFRRKKLK